MSSDKKKGNAVSLPCLYNNNSIDDKINSPDESTNVLSSYHKKAASTLTENVKRLIALAPSINHIGFMTLTFPDNVTDSKEAYNRFRSFNTNYLAPSPHFGDWICVKEPQKRGAWHYHLIIILNEDIKTGFNFDAVKNRNYTSVSKHLLYLWSDLREALPKYKFGRSELQPIRKNAEAIAWYIGKYISKGIMNRSPEQKGVRLVSYSKGWLKNSANFQWHTEGSILWRKKLAYFVASHGCTEFFQVTEKLGEKWQYRHAEHIMSISDDITEQDTLNIYDDSLKFQSPGIAKIEKRTHDRWVHYDLRLQKFNALTLPF